MSQDQLGIRDRVFRALAVGVVGAILGFVVGLSLGTQSLWFIRGPNPIAPATLVGAALGVICGFLFSDYQWKRMLRVILPFSRWP